MPSIPSSRTHQVYEFLYTGNCPSPGSLPLPLSSFSGREAAEMPGLSTSWFVNFPLIFASLFFLGGGALHLSHGFHRFMCVLAPGVCSPSCPSQSRPSLIFVGGIYLSPQRTRESRIPGGAGGSFLPQAATRRRSGMAPASPGTTLSAAGPILLLGSDPG